MEIKFKSVKERQVAYIIATGHYNQIPKIFGILMGYITKNSVNTTGHPYCTFFNNTLEVPPEELHYEIGISVIGNAPREDMIKIKKIQGHQVVSTICNKSSKYTEQLYHTLMEYAIKNGYLIAGPATEIYLNDSLEVSQSKPLVEVRFPVIKKINIQL
jgi:AraC family transcriptional regulator